MRVLSLQSAGVQSGVAVFAVGVEADNGTTHAQWVDGRRLNDPAAFAAHMTDRLGTPCTAGFEGDHGGWHAHLGEMLRRTSGPAPRTSNAAPPAADPAADRREALLSATGLGQTALAAEQRDAVLMATAEPAATAPQETFADRCRRDAAEADAADRATRAKYLKLTPLGRDALAADARR